MKEQPPVVEDPVGIIEGYLDRVTGGMYVDRQEIVVRMQGQHWRAPHYLGSAGPSVSFSNPEMLGKRMNISHHDRLEEWNQVSRRFHEFYRPSYADLFHGFRPGYGNIWLQDTAVVSAGLYHVHASDGVVSPSVTLLESDWSATRALHAALTTHPLALQLRKLFCVMVPHRYFGFPEDDDLVRIPPNNVYAPVNQPRGILYPSESY